MISQAIPKQNFEVIRDQIGAILAAELVNQHLLDNTFPDFTGKVYVERFTPVDQSEVPIVNVSISKGEFDNMTKLKANGDYMYNIDVYANATTNDSALSGDVGAAMLLQRIMGVIRGILRHPNYSSNLGLTPGVVHGTNLMRFFVADRNNAKDSLNDIVGRMQFNVKSFEQELQNTPAGSAIGTTTFYLQQTNKGYVFITN